MTQSHYNKETNSEQKKEDWMNSKWRPMMGWMYMMICMFDFMVAPILWSMMQAYFHGGVTTQWQPLTLQGAGLFHVAMGAVIGISAYGRTQEKLGGAAGQPMGTTYVPPGQGMVNVSNQPGMNNGFSGGFGGAPAGGFGGQQSSGFGGQQSGGFGGAPAGGFGGAPAGGFGAPAAGGGFGSGFNSGPGATPATSSTVAVNSAGKKVVPLGDQPEL